MHLRVLILTNSRAIAHNGSTEERVGLDDGLADLDEGLVGRGAEPDGAARMLGPDARHGRGAGVPYAAVGAVAVRYAAQGPFLQGNYYLLSEVQNYRSLVWNGLDGFIKNDSCFSNLFSFD